MKAELLSRVAIASVLASLLIFTGCATTGQSVGLGSGIGAGSGMAIGAIADPGSNGQYRTRNVVIGGAVGALVGGLTGSVIHDAEEKSRADGYKAGQANSTPYDPNEPPKLIPAQWKAQDVPAKRVGNRFIPRHVEYIITDQAHWEDTQ